MLMTSEDNKDMAISKLLSTVAIIEFAGPNVGIKSIMRSNIGHKMLIFPDIIFDNTSTLNLDVALLNYASKLGILNDVVMLPIPCIEYLVIKFLARRNIDFEFKYKWLESVLKCVLDKLTIANCPYGISYKGTFKSFEKQCKMLLENSNDRFSNINTSKISANLFYNTDSDEMNVQDKCMLLLREFPACVLPSLLDLSKYEMQYISFSELQSLQAEYISEYRKWLNGDNKVMLPDNWWKE